MTQLADELAQIGLAETLHQLSEQIKSLEQRISDLEQA